MIKQSKGNLSIPSGMGISVKWPQTLIYGKRVDPQFVQVFHISWLLKKFLTVLLSLDLSYRDWETDRKSVV